MELILQDAKEIYYTKEKYPFQEETFQIIGICMEVHKILGKGLSEVVYKDAIEFELKNKNILFEIKTWFINKLRGKFSKIQTCDFIK